MWGKKLEWTQKTNKHLHTNFIFSSAKTTAKSYRQQTPTIFIVTVVNESL